MPLQSQDDANAVADNIRATGAEAMTYQADTAEEA
jgi:hypothetical protein